MFFYYSLLSLAYASAALAATAADWRSRSVYQVMTDRFALSDGSTGKACNPNDQVYCGGTWQGIIKKLPYIQGMGFTAIWISPVTQQISQNSADGDAYHGYWQNNLYALNANFGTANDLKALAAAVHVAGMYLMVDVVPNHFAWAGNFDTVDYASYVPFNKQSYFHPYCPLTAWDYANNQTAVEVCWMGDSAVELTDVDTTNQEVINLTYSWITNLVSNYSIDGLRIDTLSHVEKRFWPGFNTAAGTYCMGEVDNGNPDYVCPYQNYVDGVLNYPMYYPITQAFQSTSGSMPNLVNGVNRMKTACKDSTLLGSFIENHDNPRFASLTNDIAQDQNAIGFTILADGIPIIYEGQEQHFTGGGVPHNREAVWTSGYSTTSPLYKFISSVNKLRNWAIKQSPTYTTSKANPIYSDTTTIAMAKGVAGSQIVAVFSNKGSSGSSYTQKIPNTGFAAGAVVVEILSCKTVTTDGSGNIVVAMGAGAANIFYPAARLNGSGICGH